jgi:ABC-2 type transport system ATP-binding protein
MNAEAIHIRDLRKSFKETEVLKGVDFEVRRGEIFALLGSGPTAVTSASAASMSCANRTTFARTSL